MRTGSLALIFICGFASLGHAANSRQQSSRGDPEIAAMRQQIDLLMTEVFDIDTKIAHLQEDADRQKAELRSMQERLERVDAEAMYGH